MNEYTPDTESVRSAYGEQFSEDTYESWGTGVDAFDRWLAGVERASSEKLEAELVARIEDRDYWYKIATEAKGQRDAALATIAKVEGLHQPYLKTYDGSDMYCKECNFQVPMRNVVWPCPTARALGSVPSTGEGNE